MNTFWILASVGVGWMAFCLLLADLLFGNERRIGKRIGEVARKTGATSSTASPLFRDWRVSDESSTDLAVRFHRFMNQTGLPIQPRHVVLASGWGGLIGAAIGYCLIPGLWWILSLLLIAAPFVGLWQVRMRRIGRLRKQLPEAFDIMRRSVEAGQTVASAFQQAAQQCEDPLAQELEFCSEQQKLGLSHDAALRELARRVPIMEFNIFVISMIVHRQCGGSPVPILDNMSELIRKRLRLANRVRALTAEGRMQALVLTVLPFAAFVGLRILRPDYLQPLLGRPMLLVGIIVAQLIGGIWVRRTIQLDY